MDGRMHSLWLCMGHERMYGTWMGACTAYGYVWDMSACMGHERMHSIWLCMGHERMHIPFCTILHITTRQCKSRGVHVCMPWHSLYLVQTV
jgi:hypothetical protein